MLCKKDLFVFLVLFSGAAQAINATSWEDSIRKVNAAAEKYYNYAVKIGGTSWAGTMYNGYKFQEHKCAILGRMLEQSKAIKHIEEFDYPPMDTRSDPHDLLVFSISLENWAAAARWAIDASESERINNWNLDCIGKFGIATNISLASPSPNADFVVKDKTLYVYGDIEVGFSKRFAIALTNNPNIKEVTLGSGGGSVKDALAAGSLIRKNGLNTTIHGNCYSACPLVFLGGVSRTLWANHYRLGFHQVYSTQGNPLPLDSETYAIIADYVATMGADPLAVISWMQSANPSHMFEPDPKDLCQPAVATFVQRKCNAK